MPASSEGFDAIIAPSTGPVEGPAKGCNKKPAALEKPGILLHEAGFNYSGKADIGPHGRRLTIQFKGTWKSRTEVRGFTRISGNGCDSGKKHWTMTSSSSSG